MRRRNQQRCHFTFALVIILLLSNILLISTAALAQEEKQLMMVFIDCEQEEYVDPTDRGYIFFEEKNYDVEVFYYEDTGEPIRADNVIIDVPWTSFFIASGDQDPRITIETPNFEEYDEFPIIASKEGYIPTEEYIIISKGDLYVSTDRDTVEEKGSFSVTVKDQNGENIPGVYILVDGSSSNADTTNQNGKIFVNAPEVTSDVEIKITAIKSGYFEGSGTIHVENIQGMTFGDFPSNLLEISPIIFALLLVILAMVFVRVRKNKTQYLPSNSDERGQDKWTFEDDRKEMKIPQSHLFSKMEKNNQTKKDESTSTKGPHVEVIKIKDTENNKKNNTLKDTNHKILPINKHDELEWFNGTDTMKHKINKLTGEDNEKPADKWFIGEDFGKIKVDKKLINKRRKKNIHKNSA